MAIKQPNDFSIFGVAGMFLFFSAILWLDFTKPSRALGLAGIVISLGVLILAFSTATGSDVYPKHCSGLGLALCELQNLLYVTGGRPAAAIPWLLFAGGVFYFTFIVFKRVRTS
jgi:hypothetical protein